MTKRTERPVLVLAALLLLGCPSHEGPPHADASPRGAQPEVVVAYPAKSEFVQKLAVPTSWETPDGGVLPVNYLEHLPIDPTRVLTPPERQELAALISQAHEDSLRLYGQSYHLSTTCAVGQLIRSNFPDAPTHEGSALFYLGDLAAYLKDRVATDA